MRLLTDVLLILAAPMTCYGMIFLARDSQRLTRVPEQLVFALIASILIILVPRGLGALIQVVWYPIVIVMGIITMVGDVRGWDWRR
jgi:hypothetical protein